MKNALSIRSANVLFLISILLVLTLGSIMQAFSLAWGLVGTEVFCIALPSLLFLRLRRIPLREGLRLRPFSSNVLLLCLALGVGGWLFAGFIDIFMLQLTGQPPVSIPSSMMPKTTLDNVMYVLALVVFAPLCEETLFRGVIQGAYQSHKTAVAAVAFSSLMFAFYHFRLTGLPALLPLAFLLGYVVWRTQSLFAGILVHMVNNGMSAAFSLVGDRLPLQILSVWSALVGLLILVAGIWALRRVTVPVAVPLDEAVVPQTEAAAGPVAVKQPGWLSAYWSLLVAGFIYLVVAGLTLAVSLNPRMTAQPGVTFQPADWSQAETYTYQVVNRAGDNVGQVVCRLQPAGAFADLDCNRNVQGYQIKLGSSQWIDQTHTAHWTARWDAQTLALVSFDYDTQFENGSIYHSTVTTEALVTVVDGKTLQADRPDGLLVEHEWPWRAVNLNHNVGENRLVNFGRLLQWDSVTNSSQPVTTQEVLQVLGGETLRVPAGEFSTIMVKMGNRSTAWYQMEGAQRLVRYDDGINFYELVSAIP